MAVVMQLHRRTASSRGGFNLFRVMFEEYRRALAAAAHYEALRRQSNQALARDGVGRDDIARCVFEQFYGGRG